MMAAVGVREKAERPHRISLSSAPRGKLGAAASGLVMTVAEKPWKSWSQYVTFGFRVLTLF